MNFRLKPVPFVVVALVATVTLVLLPSCTKNSTVKTSAPVDLHQDIKTPFRFVAYGDTRFHDPKDTEAANPPVRLALVNASAEATPALPCFTRDALYHGSQEHDREARDHHTNL